MTISEHIQRIREGRSWTPPKAKLYLPQANNIETAQKADTNIVQHNLPPIQKVCLMASFPPRQKSMLKVISQLSPQCDKMYIWLNGYDVVPQELQQFKNVHAFAGIEDLKDCGKLALIDKALDCMCLTVDDDIDYPADYVQKTAALVDKYNRQCIVSWHGHARNENGQHIYVSFHGRLDHDIVANGRVGTGVAAFVPSQIGLQPFDSKWLQYGDADILLAAWAKTNKVKMVIGAHSRKWLKSCIINSINYSRVQPFTGSKLQSAARNAVKQYQKELNCNTAEKQANIQHKTLIQYFTANGSNFGDTCSVAEKVIAVLSDVYPKYSRESNVFGRMVFIGSILNQLNGWKLYDTDVVYGSGCIKKDGPLPKNCKAKIKMVRGPLTRQELLNAGMQCPECYGDPGIFIPFAYGIQQADYEKKYDHGLVLHYADKKANSGNILQLAKDSNILVIDIYDEPEEICKQIASCKHIFSSSLHGIVVAEAMGIPTTWIELSNLVIGSGFKFYDYYLGSGRTKDDVVKLDWKTAECIDFSNYTTTKQPIYDIDKMLAAFPYKLKLNVKNEIQKWFNVAATIYTSLVKTQEQQALNKKLIEANAGLDKLCTNIQPSKHAQILPVTFSTHNRTKTAESQLAERES